MTEQRLSELLSELAEPMAPRGLAERAWQRAQHIRRRRATVGAAAVVTLAAGALTLARPQANGTGLGDPTDIAATAGQERSVSPTPPYSSTPKPERTRSATLVAGAPAWPGPRPEAERALPFLTSALPGTIDLTGSAPLLRDRPLPRATAAYLLTSSNGDLGPLLVLGAGSDGQLRRVDLPNLALVPDGQGNATSPFTRTSLSSDGTRIALAQEHEIVLLTLADASWQRFPVSGVNTDLFQWFDDNSVFSGAGPMVDVRNGAISQVDFEPYPLRSEGFPISSWWGPARRHGDLVAQAGFGTGITQPAAGTSNPEVVAVGGERQALLVIDQGDPSGVDSRAKGCCEVISWLDGDTVAFESGTEERNVLAWNTRTGQVARLTRVIAPTGWSAGASYADLTRR